MTLSARRTLRRTVRSRAVGLTVRFLASALDALPPTACIIIMMRTGWLDGDAFRPPPDRFLIDHLAYLVYARPGVFLSPALAWMLAWTALALVAYGALRRTPGKWVLGLRVRRSDGAEADGLRLFARIAASWLVPATLGLAWAWIAVNSDRRGWHDLLSGTFVVRDRSD